MGGASSCRIARSRPCDILRHRRRSGRWSRRRVSTGGVVDSGRDGVDVGGTGCSSIWSRSGPHRLRASVGHRDRGDEHLGRGNAWKRRRSTSLQLEGLCRAWQHHASCIRRLTLRGSDGAVADRVDPTSGPRNRRLEDDGSPWLACRCSPVHSSTHPTGPDAATVSGRRLWDVIVSRAAWAGVRRGSRSATREYAWPYRALKRSMLRVPSGSSLPTGSFSHQRLSTPPNQIQPCSDPCR